MSQTIQLRRDTGANWASVNPVLAAGEIGLITDLQAFKIGDGVTAWNSLLGPTQPTSTTYTDIAATAETVEMEAPDTGNLRIYAKTIAGRNILKMVGPSGLDSALQPILARNKIGMFCPPGNAITITTMGAYTVPIAVGTVATRSVAATNMFTRMRRIGYKSSATAGSVVSYRVPAAQITTGGGTAAGFFKIIRFGISDDAIVSAARMFVGVSATTGVPTNVDPSTLKNCIGVGVSDTGSTLNIFYGGSIAQTPIDLGVNFPADTANTDVYELALFSPASSDSVWWQVKRLNTGDAASGSIANAGGVALPSNTTLLTYLWNYRTNNTTAASVGLDIMSDYIETDY